MALAQKPFTYSGCVVIVLRKQSVDGNDNQNYKRILTSINGRALRWANEWFYYFQQVKQEIW